ncbi:unnamed protein product [Phaedon cochleariae]|uniref:Uncharacterized protein n=1 Tax=Phaedon cochleariae TaxID=80249 RepID=A0A9N9SJY6_PHACE|nr:unnamed protein product [Phaedon cochleariae]
MVQAAQMKSALCRHEIKSPSFDNKVDGAGYVQAELEVNPYAVENKLLRKLLQEVESKCDILNENCGLLRDKIVFLTDKLSRYEEKADNTSKNANSDKCKLSVKIRQTNHVEIPIMNESSSDLPTQATYSSVADNKKMAFNSKETFTHEEVNAAILTAATNSKMHEVQELGAHTNEPRDEQKWEKVSYRKDFKNNRRYMIGGNEENSSISTVPKMVSLHVTRLSPDTNADDLKKVLKKHFPEAQSEDYYFLNNWCRYSSFPLCYTIIRGTKITNDFYGTLKKAENEKIAITMEYFPLGYLMVSRFEEQVLNHGEGTKPQSSVFLKMRHLSNTFFLLGCGLVLSFIVFLMEIFMMRRNKKLICIL